MPIGLLTLEIHIPDSRSLKDKRQVLRRLKDPRLAGLVTVTEVRVTPDLKQARIFISVLGSEAEQAATLAGLAAASGYVRRELGQRLQLRRGPEIHFVLDRSEEYGQRIEDLLRRTKPADES